MVPEIAHRAQGEPTKRLLCRCPSFLRRLHLYPQAKAAPVPTSFTLSVAFTKDIFGASPVCAVLPSVHQDISPSLHTQWHEATVASCGLILKLPMKCYLADYKQNIRCNLAAPEKLLISLHQQLTWDVNSCLRCTRNQETSKSTLPCSNPYSLTSQGQCLVPSQHLFQASSLMRQVILLAVTLGRWSI